MSLTRLMEGIPLLTAGAPMARKKSTQYQFRCTEDWLVRVSEHADRLDIPVAMYIRQAVTMRMDSESESPPTPPKKPPRKPKP